MWVRYRSAGLEMQALSRPFLEQTAVVSRWRPARWWICSFVWGRICCAVEPHSDEPNDRPRSLHRLVLPLVFFAGERARPKSHPKDERKYGWRFKLEKNHCQRTHKFQSFPTLGSLLDLQGIPACLRRVIPPLIPGTIGFLPVSRMDLDYKNEAISAWGHFDYSVSVKRRGCRDAMNRSTWCDTSRHHFMSQVLFSTNGVGRDEYIESLTLVKRCPTRIREKMGACVETAHPRQSHRNSSINGVFTGLPRSFTFLFTRVIQRMAAHDSHRPLSVLTAESRAVPNGLNGWCQDSLLDERSTKKGVVRRLALFLQMMLSDSLEHLEDMYIKRTLNESKVLRAAFRGKNDDSREEKENQY
jgi:hypothetical protein